MPDATERNQRIREIYSDFAEQEHVSEYAEWNLSAIGECAELN